MAIRSTACTQCAKPMRSANPSPTCQPCRKARYPHGKEKGYQRGCRCADCTEAKRVAQAAYVARATAREGISPTQKYRPRKAIECMDCGKPLRTGAGKADAPRCRICGKRRGQRRQTGRQAAEGKMATAVAGTKGASRWPFFQGTCRLCGESFLRRGQVTPYCSRECRRHDRPRSWITKSARLAIYERDNWTCQLCGDPVDPNLHYRDDWSASLDHIVCRSWTLEPDHSPENLRLAHRWCNSVRGDESHYTAEVLNVGLAVAGSARPSRGPS